MQLLIHKHQSAGERYSIGCNPRLENDPLRVSLLDTSRLDLLSSI